MSALLFLFSFALSLAGLSGTVPAYRDSGDLIASIHTLGIAHPPGYALYTLLGKLFVTLLPFGNVAYRVNVMSALFAAAATALLYQTLSKKGEFISSLGASVVALVFATSPAVMVLGRVAEMYSLSACLAAGIVYCLWPGRSANYSNYAALLLGLGLSVHPTLIFLIPLFFVEPKRLVSKSVLLYGLLGLSIFLYLPLRASQHPLLNWGDPSTWRNFWRVVTRADYGGLKLHPEQSVFSWTPQSIIEQLRYFVLMLKGEWGWLGLVFGLGGVVVSVRNPTSRRWATLLLIAWILSGPFFFLLSNLPLTEATTAPILQPYLLLIGVLWAPFVFWGLASLVPIWRQGPIVAVMASLLLMGTRPWGRTSQRNDFYAYDYARNLLRSLPQGAVLYDPDDTTHFSIQVLQSLEKRRTDVVLLNFFRTWWGYEQIKRRWPDLLPPVPISNGQDLQRAFWTYSITQRPFYCDLPQKFGKVPYRTEGLAYSAQSNSRWASKLSSTERAEVMLALYPMRGDYVTTHHPDFFTRHVVDYYAAAHCNLGVDYAEAKNWGKAVEHYRAALAINPDLTAAYNNWGIVAFQGGQYKEAAELFQKGSALDPTNEMLQKNAQLALQKMRKLI